MPELVSEQAVYLVLALIVPGMIATFVRAQFLTGRMASHTDAALTYLALSVVYYAIAFPFLGLVLSSQMTGYWKMAAWFGLVFVGPFIFGLMLGAFSQLGLGRKFLQKLGLNPVHVMPTAWDWKFSNMPGSWVLVVLKDGTQFAGFCGTRSFMSSDPAERDLYIEKVFDVDEENNWRETDKSVLIGSGEIRTIEFWPVKEIAK